MLGMQHDPTFVRCALRMASVQTRLGEFAAAHTVLEAQRLVCEQHAAAGKGAQALTRILPIEFLFFAMLDQPTLIHQHPQPLLLSWTQP